ncbi:MAG: glycosyltransferase family 4 protein, partial [Nitrospiraceae bacterium]
NLSKWCAFKWHAWGGDAAQMKRSYILGNPVDVTAIPTLNEETRSEVRANMGIPPGRFIFGRVGRPALSKWHTGIIDAFLSVLSEHDVGLLLVGPPPEIVQRIHELPPSTQLRIKYFPPIHSDKQLFSVVGAMDGFLHLATQGESFGMVLCEAMVAGVPVVTLSTPLKDNSQLEVVGHERGGLVALSLDAVPKAMRRLITDSSFRRAAKANGRDWVASRFDIDTISKKAMRIYQEVLSNIPANVNKDEFDEPPNLAWIHSMLANGIGNPNLRMKSSLMFGLVHNAHVYRTYLTLRPLLRRAM